MKYDIVQTALETYVQTNWTATQVQFDNVSFTPELYNEYLRCNVLFGDGKSTSLGAKCYRQIGLLILSVFTKPGDGSNRRMYLAHLAANMVIDKLIMPVSPATVPVIYMQVPDMKNDNNERNGWVMAQVSCPFYYDTES